MNPNQDQQAPQPQEPQPTPPGEPKPATTQSNTFEEFPHIDVAPAPESMQPTAPVVAKKSRKKPILIAVAAVVVVLASAGAAFGLWYNKPENAVADSFMKMLTATSSEGVMTAKITDEGTPGIAVSANYKQAENKEAIGGVKIEIDDNGKKYNLDGSFASSKDQTYYVKVDNLRKTIDGLAEENPMVGFYTETFNDIITSVDGKWISISKSDLKELTGEDNTNKEVTCVEQKYNEFLKDSKQQNELKSLYQKHSFIKVKSLGSQTVDGVYANHYELTGDTNAANDFANGVKSLTVFKNIDNCLEQDLAKDINEQMKDAVKTDEGEKTTVEYWVSVWSHEPVKFKVKSTNKDNGVLDLEFKPKLNTKPAVTMPKADKTILQLRDEIDAATKSIYDSAGIGSTDTF